MARDVNALAIVPRFSSLSFLLPFIPLSFTWERMSVTLIPTTFVAIKLGHPIFPTVFDLQSTPSGPLRRRNALFHRANLRTTHNASLCSVYRVFQVFARKSLARSFVMFFIRVVREFVLSLNRDPSCSIEKLSMVKSFCILYTLGTCILPRLCIPRNIHCIFHCYSLQLQLLPYNKLQIFKYFVFCYFHLWSSTI